MEEGPTRWLTYELRSLDSIKLGTYGVFFQPEGEAYSARYTSMAVGDRGRH